MKRNYLQCILGGMAIAGFLSFGGLQSEPVYAANVDGYVALDSSNPVEFGGTYITYQGETIILGERAIYIDGSLTDAVADKYDYVYNDFVEAAAAFKDGTEGAPMQVYLAPYVYWIDDPDDEEVRTAASGDIPYGLIINCDYLSLIGLTDDPYNVVLAVNRGQTQGAKGNYTMFYFDGTGTCTENLTMGNYCNVDLDYPLKPELSREKRSDAITQAQLALTNGDKIVAINCNFISRLNACPFVGTAGRILFKDCHLECTDDALPGTAVFLDCTLDLYSSKPFYNTTGSGAVFLNCVFDSKVKGTQYLTKAGGMITLIDCEFKSDADNFKVEWTPEPDAALRCVMGNVTVNGEAYTINDPYHTVDITDTEAMNAYRVQSGTQTIYNTYNLLQENDGWDPLNNKGEIEAVNAEYVQYPVLMSASPEKITLKTGKEGSLKYNFRYFRGFSGPAFTDTVTWTVDEALKDYVTITPNADGTCDYVVQNDGNKAVSGMIYARSEKGFTTGTYLTVTPKTMDAPGFERKPSVEITTTESETGTKGVVEVFYVLDNEGTDISTINWYRTDKTGKYKVLVATSRLEEPEYTYELTLGDVGYYIMAEVTPKIEGSKMGEKQTVITDRAIAVTDSLTMNIITNFQNFPTDVQSMIIPGFWTVAGFKPLDTAEYDWSVSGGMAWVYGSGEGGAVGTGLLQNVRGSRIIYTPICGTYGDMSVKLVVDPCKSAGQGFGSATAQYMDVYIKMDTENLTGYALRIERTNKYSNGVDFTLMQYENGETFPISEPVSASCFNATCTIELSIVGSQFMVHVETTHEQSAEQAAAGLVHVVDLATEIEPNTFGGSGVLHTGTVGANATMLHQMEIKWDESQVSLDYDAAQEYLFAFAPEAKEDVDVEETSENAANVSGADVGDDKKDSENAENRIMYVIIGAVIVLAAAVVGVSIRKKVEKK